MTLLVILLAVLLAATLLGAAITAMVAGDRRWERDQARQQRDQALADLDDARAVLVGDVEEFLQQQGGEGR